MNRKHISKNLSTKSLAKIQMSDEAFEEEVAKAKITNTEKGVKAIVKKFIKIFTLGIVVSVGFGCSTEQARELGNTEYSIKKAVSIYKVIERESK